jgi:tetrahydrodipicolinate N-succinyltransferase
MKHIKEFNSFKLNEGVFDKGAHTVIIKGQSGGAYPGSIIDNDDADIDESLENWLKSVNMAEIIKSINCPEEDFVDYLDLPLANKLVSGYMRLEWDPEEEKTYTITEYTTKEKLSDEELDQLAEYTQSQWSSGIGETLEQIPCAVWDGEEIYISAWIPGQKLEVTQSSATGANIKELKDAKKRQAKIDEDNVKRLKAIIKQNLLT